MHYLNCFDMMAHVCEWLENDIRKVILLLITHKNLNL